MKIAVTYENGQIFQHFGHTEQLKVHDVEESKIVSSAVIGTNGQGNNCGEHGCSTHNCSGHNCHS